MSVNMTKVMSSCHNGS